MGLGIPGGSQQQASRRNVTPLVKKQNLCKEVYGGMERDQVVSYGMDKLFILFSRSGGYCLSWGRGEEK